MQRHAHVYADDKSFNLIFQTVSKKEKGIGIMLEWARMAGNLKFLVSSRKKAFAARKYLYTVYI